MPVKNASGFLPECLKSVIGQTCTKWEMIAINDHSTDHSLAILSEYAEREERIKVYNNDGNGIIEALRMAYAKSQGELISRMDADDIMAPVKLAVMKNNILRKGSGHIALGLVKYFSENELEDGYRSYANWLNNLTNQGNNFLDLYKESVIPSPSWMVFREDLDLCDGFNGERYPEDYDLCFRFYAKGLKCIPSDQILHYWRDHPLRSSRTSEYYADNRFLDLKCHYFLKLDFDKTRELVLWGAGEKGKNIAKILQASNQPFHWICNNPNKIGETIYNIKLNSIKNIFSWNKPQMIIAVANKNEQLALKTYFNQRKLKPMMDYFFFC